MPTGGRDKKLDRLAVDQFECAAVMCIHDAGRDNEPPSIKACAKTEEGKMNLTTLILVFGMIGFRAEVMAAECSSYYISEINLVSTADSEAGHVQTFVGFGPSKEEAEKNALGSCSRISFDLQTCLDSDRSSGPNAPSDASGNLLHLKYMKAVKRITGCS
jgi:hypothetical protein